MASITVSDQAYAQAQPYAAAAHRTVDEELEYLAKLARAALENPDLPVEFIDGIFRALEEVEDGEVAEFKFGEG